MEESAKDSVPGENKNRRIRHDIRNQLSSINLSLEQLKDDMPDDASPDTAFYINVIAMSCAKINALLDDIE